MTAPEIKAPSMHIATAETGKAAMSAVPVIGGMGIARTAPVLGDIE